MQAITVTPLNDLVHGDTGIQLERTYFARMNPQMALTRNEDGTFADQGTETAFGFWMAAIKHTEENVAEYYFSRTYGWGAHNKATGHQVCDDFDSEEELIEWCKQNGYRAVRDPEG